MSHCCGGCGGEDPSKTKAETKEKDSKAVESQASKAETNTATTGTWDPAKKQNSISNYAKKTAN